MIGESNFKNKLILSIILLIGFQAFPIIKIGGTFKIYELLALVVLFIDVAYINKFKFANNVALAAGCFFVVSPIISYINSNLFLGYPDGFYRRYPEANSFKYNFYVFPFLQLIYMFFNFSVFNSIVISSYLFKNFEKILKYSVIVGSCISLYSLFAMFVVDIVRLLPSFIQNRSFYEFRSLGFSQEPSFYVLYQVWICLFAWFAKHLFKRPTWNLIILLNISSLLLTFSSALAGLFVVILLSVFIFNSSLKVKMQRVLILLVVLLSGYLAIIYFDLWTLFEYSFISKVSNFLAAPVDTMDSGSFRRYTSEIGIRMFKDHWLAGVGIGNSIYYMYIYEFKMGIEVFGDTLGASIFPQSLFSCVLSEQGIIGGASLLWFLFAILRKFWVNRNKSNYGKMFLLGTIFNIVVMFSIAPVYALYIWVFIALGLCYIKYYKTENHVKTLSSSYNQTI